MVYGLVNPLLHSIQLKGLWENSVDRDQTPENLVPSHKIMIIFIFYSFWRMAKNSFFTYEFGTVKSFNTH